MSTGWRRNAHRGGLMILSLFIVGTLHSVALAAQPPDQAARNAFNTNCVTCHGEGGSGDTAVGKSLHVPDFHSSVIQKQSDAQLHRAIASGQGSMPAFSSTLTTAQIDSLVSYIRALAKPGR